ncbi:nonstructural protein [Microviridae sp.]|nr:nonstructural protein [Microviridae sp.]
MQMFSVYDSKVQSYSIPFYSRTAEDALRKFSASVNDLKTPYSFHPEDYTLFHIGEFLIATGSGSIFSAYISLANGKEVVDQDLRQLIAFAELSPQEREKLVTEMKKES